MTNKLMWWKSALLVLAAGTTLSLGLGGAYLSELIQRILIDMLID